MKKILKILCMILISIIVVCSVVIVTQKLIWKDKIPSIFGYKSFIVLSGSMEPTLSVGDIVFVKETKDIKEQDIIAFRINNSIVTHRLVEIIDEEDGKKYKTKGDSNTTEDLELLKIDDIEGKYSFKIGKLGNIILFLKTKTGIIILVILFSISILFSNDKTDKEKKVNK